MKNDGIYKLYIKRLCDIIISLVAVVLLSPIILIVALLVKIKLGSPVIFVQKRPGKDEKIFNMYKFRTMIDKYDNDGELLSDEYRLTNFGKILRSTSLDELPELWNILKGDMSLVGPRPLLIEYLDLYNQNQKKRHLMRPGLTGLAQVNGRNAISWNEKFFYDVKYVNDVSFLLDMKIIFITIKKIFIREGISDAQTQTSSKFTGNINEEHE